MKICPKCGGSDYIKVTPPWAQQLEVHGCQSCGFVGGPDDRPVIQADELFDCFRAATLVDQNFPDVRELPAATKAVMTARLMSFGTEMWFDGLKQGLMYGQIWCKQGNPVSGSKE